MSINAQITVKSLQAHHAEIVLRARKTVALLTHKEMEKDDEKSKTNLSQA